MTLSRSTPSDSFPDDPKDRNESEGAMNERGQTWHEGCTPGLHDHFCKVAYSRVRLFIEDPYEAMRIAEQVADELAVREVLPLEPTGNAYIRQRAEWRALSYLRSSRYGLRSHCDPLFQIDEEDEEEYEAVPVSSCSIAAEEEFFRAEDMRCIEQAIDNLHGIERACFVLRLIDGKEVPEVAQMLNISRNYVSQATIRAANKVARFLEAQGMERPESRKKRKEDIPGGP